MTSPEISVVIPVREAHPCLLGQLAALSRQAETPSAEVIVAANGDVGSIAGLVGAAGAKLPGLRIVDASAHRGVAYARNIGAAHASGGKLLFCDADDLVGDSWVSSMNSVLDEFDLVGGKLDLTALNDSIVRVWYGGQRTVGLPCSMGYLRYAVGANMGVRADVYAALGGFDENFVGGHEEVDLAWRAQEAGYRLGYAADAVVQYRLRTTLGGLYRQRYSYGRTYSQLFARYRSRIALRTSLATEAARGLSLARQFLTVRDRAALGYAVYAGGWFVGRVVGGLRYRALGPDYSDGDLPDARPRRNSRTA